MITGVVIYNHEMCEEVFFMWNKDKSIMLTSCIIKAVYVAVAVCCVTAPLMVRYYDDTVVLAHGDPSVFLPLLITLYCVVPPAVAALILLDMLLGNIKKGEPFTQKNVNLLRALSYCCFAVSVVFIYFSFLKPFAFVIVFAAAFMGLILRVIKNCFEQAVALREENDFTI